MAHHDVSLNICDEIMLFNHLIFDENISEVGYASINM
jgi:hypothetical protein